MELISHISFPDLHEKLFAKCFLSLPFPPSLSLSLSLVKLGVQGLPEMFL